MRPTQQDRRQTKILRKMGRLFIARCLTPAGWHQEHDVLHHYNLGEKLDPDHLQHNMEWFRQSQVPMWLRFMIVVAFTTVWKILYYTPRTHKELRLSSAR